MCRLVLESFRNFKNFRIFHFFLHLEGVGKNFLILIILEIQRFKIKIRFKINMNTSRLFFPKNFLRNENKYEQFIKIYEFWCWCHTDVTIPHCWRVPSVWTLDSGRLKMDLVSKGYLLDSGTSTADGPGSEEPAKWTTMVEWVRDLLIWQLYNPMREI